MKKAGAQISEAENETAERDRETLRQMREFLNPDSPVHVEICEATTSICFMRSSTSRS